jgi:diketogulonate reductase-like aldo/keto reductase
VSASQIAIAWVRGQQERAVVIPTVGVRTERQLVDSLEAAEIDLDPDEPEHLDRVSRIALGFPGEFDGTRLAYGNRLPRIDDHRGALHAIA